MRGWVRVSTEGAWLGWLLLSCVWWQGKTGSSRADSFFAGPVVTLNDPVDEVFLVGNILDLSTAPLGLVQLATITFTIQAGASGVSLMEVMVDSLVTCSACDGNDNIGDAGTGVLVEGVSAAVGYVSLGGGGRQLSVPAPSGASVSTVHRAWRHVRRQLSRPRELSSDCCAGEIGSGVFFGDTDGDCAALGGNDIAFATDLQLRYGSGSIPTLDLGGVSLCEWQRTELDATRDGEFKQNDLIFLLNVYAGLYRFLHEVPSGLPAPGCGTQEAWRVTATLYDKLSQPATSQVDV